MITQPALIELNESDRLTLVHSLRIAAERFVENQKTSRESGLHPGAAKALVSQFERQAEDALRLADLIENAGAIFTTPPDED